MGAAVWIPGSYQSDLARNLTKQGLDFADLTAEVVDGTLASAKLDSTDVGLVQVGTAFGEMLAAQAHLGATPATVCDALWGIPASRHEAACASGQHRDAGGDTDEYLRDHPGARPIGRIDGWGHHTVGLGLRQKLDRAADVPYVLPHVRAVARDALGRAQASLDERLPINPNGGLIGDGPVSFVVTGAEGT